MKISKFAATFFALLFATSLTAYYNYQPYDYSNNNLNNPSDAFQTNPNFQYTPGVRGPSATPTYIPSPSQDNVIYQNQGYYQSRYTDANHDQRFQGSYRNFPTSESLDQSYQYNKHADEWADTNYADTTTTSNIVEARVHTALQKDQTLSQAAKNLQVSESDGVVTLTGNVPTKAEKDKVTSIVKNVDGVKTLVDRITIAQ